MKMRYHRMSIVLGTVVLLGTLLVARLMRAEDEKKTAEPAGKAERFHKELLEVAGNYRTYGRVDDEYRWAPWLCRTPLPGKAHFSRSTDEATHGQKLYSVFASNRDAYLLGLNNPSPVGQVIVKESWVPEEVKLEDLVGQRRQKPAVLPQPGHPALTDHFDPYASKEGKRYKAGQKSSLFIMMRLDPKTPGTDDGWVYGTVSPNGSTVTSAGRVDSCMRCHETRTDRLFGIPGVHPQKVEEK
jgi:hypothetical protein